MGSPDVELIRKGHKAYSDGDFDTIGELLADDVVWHSPGKGPFAGTFRGRDEVMNRFFLPQKDAPIRLETRDVLTGEEYLASIGDIIVRADGEDRRFMFTEVITIRDGRLKERWGFVEDPTELEANVARAMGA